MANLKSTVQPQVIRSCTGVSHRCDGSFLAGVTSPPQSGTSSVGKGNLSGPTVNPQCKTFKCSGTFTFSGFIHIPKRITGTLGTLSLYWRDGITGQSIVSIDDGVISALSGPKKYGPLLKPDVNHVLSIVVEICPEGFPLICSTGMSQCRVGKSLNLANKRINNMVNIWLQAFEFCWFWETYNCGNERYFVMERKIDPLLFYQKITKKGSLPSTRMSLGCGKNQKKIKSQRHLKAFSSVDLQLAQIGYHTLLMKINSMQELDAQEFPQHAALWHQEAFLQVLQVQHRASLHQWGKATCLGQLHIHRMFGLRVSLRLSLSLVLSTSRSDILVEGDDPFLIEKLIGRWRVNLSSPYTMVSESTLCLVQRTTKACNDVHHVVINVVEIKDSPCLLKDFTTRHHDILSLQVSDTLVDVLIALLMFCTEHWKTELLNPFKERQGLFHQTWSSQAPQHTWLWAQDVDKVWWSHHMMGTIHIALIFLQCVILKDGFDAVQNMPLSWHRLGLHTLFVCYLNPRSSFSLKSLSSENSTRAHQGHNIAEKADTKGSQPCSSKKSSSVSSSNILGEAGVSRFFSVAEIWRPKCLQDKFHAQSANCVHSGYSFSKSQEGAESNFSKDLANASGPHTVGAYSNSLCAGGRIPKRGSSGILESQIGRLTGKLQKTGYPSGTKCRRGFTADFFHAPRSASGDRGAPACRFLAKHAVEDQGDWRQAIKCQDPIHHGHYNCFLNWVITFKMLQEWLSCRDLKRRKGVEHFIDTLLSPLLDDVIVKWFLLLLIVRWYLVIILIYISRVVSRKPPFIDIIIILWITPFRKAMLIFIEFFCNCPDLFWFETWVKHLGLALSKHPTELPFDPSSFA
nr:ORF2 [Mamastrovirus 3]